MTNLFHRNYEFAAVDNKYPKIPPSTSVQFATLVRRSRDVRLSYLHVSLCRQNHRWSSWGQKYRVH